MKKTLASLAVLTVLASCGTDAEEAQTVTILTHDSFVITDDQIAAFEEESGYTLQTIAPGDGGVLVNQLILNRDNPQADGVYGIDTFIVRTVLEEDLLAPYTSAQLPGAAEDLVIDESLTPIDQGDVCINIDTAWFDEQGMAEPSTLDDLTDPQYAELLAVIDPETSSPGYAFLAATEAEYGEGMEEFWTALLDGGARISSGWSDAYYSDFSGADGNGPYPLALSYSSSPAAADGTSYLPDTCVRQVEYAGVVANAENPDGAQAFIDFMLSDEIQSTIPENMYMYPVSDVELPAEWQEVAELSDTPILVDAQTLDRQDLLERFAAIR